MLKIKFVADKLNARTLGPLTAGSELLLGVPGGPGIPGHYMDDSTFCLARELAVNALVVDLPNHGHDVEINSYADVRAILFSFLEELARMKMRVSVVGHSLGGILAGYFVRKLKQDEFTLLADKTFGLQNRKFTMAMPTTEMLARQLSPTDLAKIFYLQGDYELPLAADNLPRIRAALPGARVEVLSQTGHFPMLESREKYEAMVLSFLKE